MQPPTKEPACLVATGHHLDLPHMRRHGVRAAAQHTLHNAGWACDSADLEPVVALDDRATVLTFRAAYDPSFQCSCI